MSEIDKIKTSLAELGWTYVQLKHSPAVKPTYAVYGVPPNGFVISGYSDESFRDAYNDALGKSIAAGAAEDANIV
jgi:hypothetical protein